VLRVLLADLNQSIHMREIARRSGLAVATVQRELKILVGVGLVERTRQLQQVLYRPAVSSEAIAPLRMLLQLDADAMRDLASALANFGPRVRLAFVIDADAMGFTLIVVGEVRFEELFAIVTPIETQHGKTIRLLAFTSEGFESQRGRFDLTRSRMLVGDLAAT